MNWLTKLERKYGRICIPNLISILVGAQVLVYAVELFVNQYVSLYLSLSRTALLMGQVWRVITFVFVPFSGGGPLSVILGIYFTWFIGSALEKEWGDFRFNLYLLLGMVGAVAACLLTGYADNYCLSLSLLLALVCGGAVGAQLSGFRHDGKTELSALYAELRRLLRPAGLAQCPCLGPPGAVETEEPPLSAGENRKDRGQHVRTHCGK